MARANPTTQQQKQIERSAGFLSLWYKLHNLPAELSFPLGTLDVRDWPVLTASFYSCWAPSTINRCYTASRTRPQRNERNLRQAILQPALKGSVYYSEEKLTPLGLHAVGLLSTSDWQKPEAHWGEREGWITTQENQAIGPWLDQDWVRAVWRARTLGGRAKAFRTAMYKYTRALQGMRTR